MVELGVITEIGTVVEEGPRREPEEGELLAVALAAALVEYQRHTKQQKEHESPGHNGTNWRMMSRWEQLTQQAAHK
jgi:hypothetical protein